MTAVQQKRFERNKAVAREYQELVAGGAQSSMAVIKHLQEKYQIYSHSTVYQILKEEGVETKAKQEAGRWYVERS